MVKKLSVVFIAALLLTLTACGIIVLDNTRYGNFLQSYLTPGFKAQTELNEECEFLAIDPDANGIYVFHEDNTISYFDDSLTKLGTYEYSGFDASIDYSLFPAASRDIGNNRIAMVPFGKLQWLVLFGDSMTFVEKLTMGGINNYRHSLMTGTNIVFNINQTPAYMKDYGSFYDSYDHYFNAIAPAPILAYTHREYIYALQIMNIQPNEDNAYETYTGMLYKCLYPSSPSNANPEGSPLTLSITVPTGIVPQYFYVNDVYAAIIFAPIDQDSGLATICALFSRTTGELKQMLTQNNDTGTGHYGFSATRIYYEKNKRLYAVEVTP